MALPVWLQTLLTRLPEQRTRMVPLTGSGNQNLEKIDHIVVLMMENRSFDHMLGYLKLDGVMPEVEGLERSRSPAVRRVARMKNPRFMPSAHSCASWKGRARRPSIPASPRWVRRCAHPKR